MNILEWSKRYFAPERVYHRQVRRYFAYLLACGDVQFYGIAKDVLTTRYAHPAMVEAFGMVIALAENKKNPLLKESEELE